MTNLWTIGVRPAERHKGASLLTKEVDHNLVGGADGHLGKIQIYGYDADKLEVIAATIVTALNKEHTT